MGLFKTLLYIFLIYVAVRFIQRVFMVRTAVKDMRSRMEDFSNNPRYDQQRREGEMTIKKGGSGKSGRSFEEGEYVDYEDIE